MSLRSISCADCSRFNPIYVASLRSFG